MNNETTTVEYGNVRELIECCYDELKRQSRRKMAMERKNHSWTASVLVNELVGKLLSSKAPVPLEENEFYRYASQAMTNLLTEHANWRNAQKRSYDKREYLDLQHVVAELSPNQLTGDQWLDLQQILEELSQVIPRAVKIFQMRILGFTNNESAASHGISAAQASADYKRVISHLIMRFDTKGDTSKGSGTATQNSREHDLLTASGVETQNDNSTIDDRGKNRCRP